MDLLGDVRFILRQSLGQLGELAAQENADAADQQKSERDGSDDRGHATEVPPPQQDDQRPKREAQKNGEGQRHEDIAPDIERGNDDDADHQGSERRGRRSPRADLGAVLLSGRGGGVRHLTFGWGLGSTRPVESMKASRRPFSALEAQMWAAGHDNDQKDDDQNPEQAAEAPAAIIFPTIAVVAAAAEKHEKQDEDQQ